MTEKPKSGGGGFDYSSLNGMGGGGGDTLVAQAESTQNSAFNMGSGPVDKTIVLVLGIGGFLLFGLIIAAALIIPKRKGTS